MVNFNEFKDILAESANIENILKECEDFENSNEFKTINEADSQDDLSKNLVGTVKVKMLQKKLTKAQTAKELEKINYAKITKHMNGGKEEEVAKKKHEAIDAAIDKKETAFKQSMDAIGTTDYLKQVVAKAKAEATEKSLQTVMSKVADDDREAYKDKLADAKEAAGRNEEGIAKWNDDHKDDIDTYNRLQKAAKEEIEKLQDEMDDMAAQHKDDENWDADTDKEYQKKAKRRDEIADAMNAGIEELKKLNLGGGSDDTQKANAEKEKADKEKAEKKEKIDNKISGEDGNGRKSGDFAKQQLEKKKKELEELKKDPETNKEKIKQVEDKIAKLEQAIGESEKYTDEEFTALVESIVNDIDQILNS